jgi:hypothetical protein
MQEIFKLLRVIVHLPLVLEFYDDPEVVASLLSRIQQMVPAALWIRVIKRRYDASTFARKGDIRARFCCKLRVEADVRKSPREWGQ